MDKTKTEWCDATWNPVTGCYHGCEYCYARRIAERFGAKPEGARASNWTRPALHELDAPAAGGGPKRRIDPYPYGFEPTLHRYRLGQPSRWKDAKTVFVCSMADLFGDWVPDEWIRAVFDACKAAPRHRYVFLTKNPARYCDLHRKGLLPDACNFWFGATFDHSNWTGDSAAGRPPTFSLRGEMIHDAGDYYYPVHPERHRMVCFEPLVCGFGEKGIGSIGAEWVIIGAETGSRKGKVVPKREWVDGICEAADREGAAVFMKDSLIPVVGEENMRRELPWGGI